MRVDKELYGDVFRGPPKLTPLEARAIRLAIEYVGPTIAAEAHTPLDRVRKKLEETFGQFELAQTPQAARRRPTRRSWCDVLSDGAEKRRVVEIEYLKEGEEHRRCASSSRTRSSASCRLARPHLGPHGRRRRAHTVSTACARRS